MQCPYCSGTQTRSTTTATNRHISECATCLRVVSEYHTHPHHLFHLRAHDTPLCLVTSDLPTPPPTPTPSPSDPFQPTGFITAFSTYSLEPYPVTPLSSLTFSGHLAQLEKVLDTNGSGGVSVVVDNLRAYLQIIDVASILRLEYEIAENAFQLFRECCSATCLRNRSVEALATAALVQAIREAQEPRTLQEISLAANLPQKEIGKYIKILGESLQLSQPINSNSISVHMPRFCTLLQLNKSAQELATHIGEVVINKCFCTRRNPISISAAAIYLACQLEDRRKTQAEICKVTGLTEVTLRKVYKELLENWDDLLPSNYNPVVPPEKAFPTATITSGRSSVSKVDPVDAMPMDRDRQADIRPMKSNDASQPTSGEGDESKNSPHVQNPLHQMSSFWRPLQPPLAGSSTIASGSSMSKVDPVSSMSMDRDRHADIFWPMKPYNASDASQRALGEGNESENTPLQVGNTLQQMASFWRPQSLVGSSSKNLLENHWTETHEMEIDSVVNPKRSSN
ncbi:hypothetical protein Leryth_002531 [Lithospermum erythrorhizon]|nr:hypothetical protein Leryth_002531 [Lithospermum erythrorhizon]